jgi:hypothetical protein
MIVATISRRMLATVVMAVLLVMLCGASQASAAPWWHVTTISSPAKPAGGEGKLVVDVGNLGDAYVNGQERPITIADRLPVGVTATRIYMEGGGGTGAETSAVYNPAYTKCSLVSVTCTFTGPVLSYEHLMLKIIVQVAPGAGDGVNEVSVSGGGVAPVLSRRPLALEASGEQFGVENYELSPEEEGGGPDTQAGSHPFQLTTTLVLNTAGVPTFGSIFNREIFPLTQPVALTKDLRFNLPAGLVGNPTPLPKCSMQVFTRIGKQGSGGNIECPENTVVGVATPIIMLSAESLLNPRVFSTPLFSLEPSVGEPARFGFMTLVGPVILDTAVRTGGDYGVVVTVPDITEAAGFIGNEVTFWGTPADPRHDNARGKKCLDQYEEETGGVKAVINWERFCHVQEKSQPLLVMPTSCTGPLRTTVETDSWNDAGQFTAPFEYLFANSAGEPFGMDGCNRLNFEPSISVAPDGQQGSTPTGLTVGVHVPQDASLNPTGFSEAAVKDTTVTLPAGVALNPAAADGLMSCSTEQVGLESPAAISCPEASKVGTVEVATPLLPDPLVGAAYLASQDANPFGSLVALYIVAEDRTAGVLVKLAGEVKPDAVTGQLVSTFKNTPQLPFEDLRLHFFGGSRAPLATPGLCGAYTTTASIAPWSGNEPVDSSSTFDITSGPNHTPCSDPLPFVPSLTAGSLSIQAGDFSPFTMTMSRPEGNQNLQAVQLHMPVGFLGEVSSVKQCGEGQANAGTCGPESLIGHTVVSVGVGGNPYSVTGGEVFFTGPYKGAPYGLSIVNPAKAGPFDLGKVVVRARIEVDPITAALTVTTDQSGPYAIPHILDGIPLQIQHVNVSVDRPNFTFNPTDCNKLAITGSLTSDQGASSTLSVPYQVTNCAVLKFKPLFRVTTQGHTSRKEGASLNVRLSYPTGSFGTAANIAKVKVDLPKQLPSRLTTLQKACPDSVFTQNPAACPPGSRVGSATASTPVIATGFSGPAYFVSHGGAKFPELIIVLSGGGVSVQLHGETFISKAGITSSTFRQVPDVPIGAFELHLPEGPGSALAANGNLCTSTLKMPTTFVAQNGMSIHQSTPVTATGCPKHKKTKKARARKANASKHNKSKTGGA